MAHPKSEEVKLPRVRVPAEVHRRMQLLMARENRRTLSELARALLIQAVETEKEKEERLKLVPDVRMGYSKRRKGAAAANGA